MATQSRDEAHRSECFQIRCLKSAVRLEPARRRGYEGLRAIDTAPTVSAAVRGPRDPNFLRYLASAGEVRASVSLPRSSISALIGLGLGSELSGEDRFAPIPIVL